MDVFRAIIILKVQHIELGDWYSNAGLFCRFCKFVRVQTLLHSSRVLVRFSSSILLLTVAVMAIFGGPATASASTQAPASQGSRFYPATGFSVGGAFLQFFDKYGGVRIFGYPISNELAEGGMTVQYFERQRFEYHKEAIGTPYEVQLGALGVEASRGKVPLSPVAPIPTTNERLYFRETGHSLSGAFLAFWSANGSVRVLGSPSPSL